MLFLVFDFSVIKFAIGLLTNFCFLNLTLFHLMQSWLTLKLATGTHLNGFQSEIKKSQLFLSKTAEELLQRQNIQSQKILVLHQPKI